MTIRTLTTATAVLAAGLGPGAALAGAAGAAIHAPKLSSKTIVLNQSIAGIGLNEKFSQARKAFDRRDCTPSGCSYVSPDAQWTIYFVAGKPAGSHSAVVEAITIRSIAPTSTPLSALKTKDGIGIGSTVTGLKHAYPSVRGSAPNLTYPGHGATKTTFSTAGNTINTIRMQSVA